MNTTTTVVVSTTKKAFKEDSNFAIVGGVLGFALVLVLFAYCVNTLVARRVYTRKQRDRQVEIWTTVKAPETDGTLNAVIPKQSVYSYDQ